MFIGDLKSNGLIWLIAVRLDQVCPGIFTNWSKGKHPNHLLQSSKIPGQPS